MNKAEVLGRLELRIEEIEFLYVKGKRKDDETRLWAEAKIEGLKEAWGFVKLMNE